MLEKRRPVAAVQSDGRFHAKLRHPGVDPALTFWIFALFSLLAFLYVLAIVPKTKGRSLKESELSWTKCEK